MKNKRKNQTSEQPKFSRVQFEDAFQKFTQSSNRSLQLKNLQAFLETLGLNQAETNGVLNQILTSLATEEDRDSITLEELSSLLDQKFSTDGEHYNKVTFTFELFDIDKKGYVDAADLMRISKELGQDITEQEFMDMLDRVASNNQRDRVYKNDFKKLMEKLSLF